jgi:hypothetical protein
MSRSYSGRRRGCSLTLRLGQPLDPAAGEVEQLVEQFARERVALGGRLHLDELPVSGHDDVHVRLGGRVLLVVEVQQRVAAADPDRDRRYRATQRLREAEAVERPRRSDPGAGDRRASRPAVRLEDVAVEPERPLAERLEVADGAQRAADEPLDLDRSPVGPPARHGTLRPLAGRSGQHRVLGGHPAAPAAVEPAWHTLLDRGGAEHDRLPLAVEHRAVRLLEEVGPDRQLAQLVRPPAVGAGAHWPTPVGQ